MRKETGFTLVELLVTVIIVAIVLTLAIPGLQAFLSKNQVAAATNQFVASLALAKSEAIKRGQRVTICKSTNGSTCTTTGGWDQGWIIFVDVTSPQGDTTSDGSPFRIIDKQSGVVINGDTNFANYISYMPSGISDGGTSGIIGNGTLNICSSPYARNIILNLLGRVRSEAASC